MQTNQICDFGFFLDFFYSEKPILKVNILITGIIHPTFIIPNSEDFGRMNHSDYISCSTVYVVFC